MRVALAALAVLLSAVSVRALDHVAFERDGQQRTVQGRILVTAQDGGVLLQSRDGALWSIENDQIVSQSADETPFIPLTSAEMAKHVLNELPPGFDVHTTHRYLICYNTSRAYASWCGALFERLHLAFTNYWSRKDLKLSEPEFPLVAIVFNTRDSYAAYTRDELGDAAPGIVGYYSLRSNRIMMYDLTGIESLRGGGRGTTAAQINRVLAQPAAEQVVATIIHEATHQIAFNSGMQTRFADIPLWLSEGLAVYFETPDLQSARGWRGIGGINIPRLERFRRYLRNRPSGSLESLLVDDSRLRDARTALDAYAEAWALNYYLIQRYPRQYAGYLAMLATKPQLVWDDRATRLREFRAAFGDDLDALDADFVRQMQKL